MEKATFSAIMGVNTALNGLLDLLHCGLRAPRDVLSHGAPEEVGLLPSQTFKDL